MINIAKSNVMEDKIKEVLDEAGLTIDVMTPEEIEQLKEEISSRENGRMILDGVLSNPELYYRVKRQ